MTFYVATRIAPEEIVFCYSWIYIITSTIIINIISSIVIVNRYFFSAFSIKIHVKPRKINY